MVAVSPYKTAEVLNRPAPAHVSDVDDQLRVRAYYTYADIYHNVAEAFQVLLRNDDEDLIARRYVPAARTIIEATNRYLGKAPSIVWSVEPGATVSAEQQVQAATALDRLFAREEFRAKFMAFKRWMLIKGDGILHVSADPMKPEGTRLRITEIPPEQYFPIYDPVDAERVVGCYIVSLVQNDDDEEIAQRIEYRRILSEEDVAAYAAPLGSVYVRYSFWAPDGWDDRDSPDDLESVDVPSWAGTESWALALNGFALPAQITALPVYHFRNRRRGTEPFGISELQGIETLLAGVIQAATDEDLAIALQSVGMYATDSGSPKNADGSDADWEIAPGSVAELEKGGKMWRIDGIQTVQPIQDHVNMLKADARETTGTPDVAVGKVDVQAAESGISLAIQMAPITAKNAETEEELKSKLNQFLFGLLNGWMPAYEGVPAVVGLIAEIEFADPLPVNEEAVVKRVVELVKNKIVSVRWACEYLKETIGLDLDPLTMVAEIAAEAATMLDATGARLEEEAVSDGESD